MFTNKLHSAGFASQAGSLFLGLIFSVWASTVNATALIEQSPLDGGNAYQSNWTGGSQYADNFSLAYETTVTSIQWWGSYSIQGEDDFKIRIFSDASSSPDVNPVAEYISPIPPSISRTSTSLTDSGAASVFAYELTSLNLTLPAGNYFLSIINNEDISTVNTGNPSDWLWLQSGTGDLTAWNRQLDGDTWGTAASVQGPANFSFTLNGTQQPPQPNIPEPGMPLLFALSALVFGMRRLLKQTSFGAGELTIKT